MSKESAYFFICLPRNLCNSAITRQRFLTENVSPEIVCRPGSDRPRCGAYSTPPDSMAGLGRPTEGVVEWGGERRTERTEKGGVKGGKGRSEHGGDWRDGKGREGTEGE